MPLDPVKLSEWLRKAMLSPKLPPISQILLNQTFQTGEAKLVWTKDWDEGEVRPRVEEMIQEIDEAATTWADGKAEGVVRFEIEAYHGNTNSKWGVIFAFHLVGRSPEATSATFGSSEPATPAGHLAQLMRHLENREQSLIKKDEQIGKLVTKIMDDATKKVDKYEKSHLDTVSLYEDLLDRRHDRELKSLMEARVDERKSKAWNMAMSLGSIIVSQVISPRLAAALPSGVTDGGPAMHLIRRFMKKMNEDKMMAIAPALDEEDLMIVSELHRIVSNEADGEAKKEEDARHAVPTSADDLRAQKAAEASAQSEEKSSSYADAAKAAYEAPPSPEATT